ncbi:2-oxoglutarate-dependent ethylene/succinate-forming enzyme [Rhodobacteraceae bacterium THAF1]|uniref:isopenicillin N synthase family dioxygenase n=1 Tax=Palleronia sp. THAF1 TaxID=2587842 RepID=UPI000F3F29F3|nr:2-oxoglutarate and iron-dependent oxygenase domain-containing protein [Palleronia sp. THAF1]QFU08627.1 2-oxoglutarate-dependent ethylene/succinate-forming enzyme [Palleronia sp. THAF1]VDC30750.1 2-oxoglutarate-dependent ethylene/succinate-forming enzyme [Rhodobacteraceae bacterium THAF1]
MIPAIDATRLHAPDTLQAMHRAATETGFLTVTNTRIGRDGVDAVIAAYLDFFRLPHAEKARIDMAATGSNRGWGAPGAERVDPTANPDYKQVFDMGLELDANDPMAAHGLKYYAPNRWPEGMPAFQATVEAYYAQARATALDLLRALAAAIGQPSDYFDDKFDRPMALLRGNYYPPRPANAGARDFGIAPHTDYGCLTLLATDGTAGLEVQTLDGTWEGISAAPGTFVVNFGEMLEMWTNGTVRATPHRVIGTQAERVSVPLFFNPNYDTNVAPMGSGQTILAGDHLSKRYDETYLHLTKA